ncbi:Ion transport 2 domain protein [Rippkaea orientalis PCC 8801]|uniref:Ion transport 2 domain protein n=1 Tax=Rippkaea orientalis (strain PCC 8801 / RF-1) TaxID=41431 RepID=B7K3R7_RIPO1|nr:ion transporter [Rippkaea orientalis]ACK66457.1 Ion transport 2 domain protein [Rippkaea orientalis PCC 8801]
MVDQPITLKKKLSHYLDDFDSLTGIIINLIILGLILLSFLIFVVETYPISESLLIRLKQLDKIILLVFTLEYIIRFWCSDNKLRFLFSFFSWIDLLAIVPLFVGFLDIRYILIIRWFRILRLIRLIELATFLLKIKTEDGVILTRIFLSLLSLVFIYSGAIYQIEHQTNPQIFENFFDALYFSIVTMTTVGFGDVTPLSETGKFITLMMIISGIILIPWQISILTQQLLKITNKSTKLCFHCGLTVHEHDANFCKICGAKLEKKQEIIS